METEVVAYVILFKDEQDCTKYFSELREDEKSFFSRNENWGIRGRSIMFHDPQFVRGNGKPDWSYHWNLVSHATISGTPCAVKYIRIGVDEDDILVWAESNAGADRSLWEIDDVLVLNRSVTITWKEGA
jgi:hypothetical protein